MSVLDKLTQIANLDLSGPVSQLEQLTAAAQVANEAATQTYQALKEAGKMSGTAGRFQSRTLEGQAAEDAYNRSINPFGTAPDGWAESAQRGVQAMNRFIESLAASGNQQAITRFRQQNQESVAEYAQMIRQAQERLDDAKDRNLGVETQRLQRLLQNYQETQQTFQRRIEQLDRGVAAAKTAGTSGVTQTYEIKFTTASGQQKTLTTTTNPEDFLAALEAAQRRSV